MRQGLFRVWVTSASIVIFGFVSPLSLLSQAQQYTPPDIKTMVLPSGQHVYVQEIHSQPIVTIDTWVDTGSAQETPEINGVSHFLEHLLFKGTTHHPLGEIDRTLESKGADFNAATSDDFTHFHITTASQYFQTALQLHADMLLNATINPPELDRERKVVQEEINRALDNPGRKAIIALDKDLYAGHPYSMDTLGPTSNIQDIPRDSILAYYHKWYQPKNFNTVIVGDVKADEVFKEVNDAFQAAYSEQARPEPGMAQVFPVTSITSPKSSIIADPNVSQDQIELGFIAPPVGNTADNAALDVAAIILGQGSSSRLYQHLKEDKQLVTDVSASNSTQQQSGTFSMSADVKPENRVAAEKAMIEELQKFRQNGPTTQELDKAKTQVVKDFGFLNESTEGVAQTIGYNVTIGKLSDYTDYVAEVQKVTTQQVLDVVRKYLDPRRAALVEVVPASSNPDVTAQTQQNESFLASVPDITPGEATDITKAETKTIKTVLPNGATLLVKPTPETQTVSFAIFARGGQLAEPSPGVSDMMARVLTKGTISRSNEEIDQTLDSQGLSLSAASSDDYVQISGSSLTANFDQLLLLTEDILTHPTFPTTEIEKERADLLEEIKTQGDQPGPLMFRKLTETLYAHHPYGNVGDKLAAGVKKLTRENLIAFYHQEIQPKNLVISVVGHVDPAQVKATFEQMTNGLYSSTPFKNLPSATPLLKDELVTAQKPEQAATWIGYAWLAPAITETQVQKDYLALKIINTLLGSGLSSRLFVDLREKQGLAYQVSTQYPSTMKTGHFTMYIGTNPKNQDQVLKGFDMEIKRLQTEPLTPEELDNAKNKLIGLFALAHESNASQAYYQGVYETLGAGYQFDTTYPELIETVTSADVQRVAKTYFSRPRVTVIVAPKVVRTDNSVHPAPHATH